jgi:hypothetical protein
MNWFRRLFMSKKPKISAEVSPEEFDAYKTEAARLGMNMSEWIRRALNSTVSKDFKEPAPAVAEAAFQKLDASEALGGVTVTAATPPVSTGTAASFQTLPKPPPAPSTQHPCVNLDLRRPGVLTAGECSGTCMAAAQRGKPCFFGPMNARTCAHFLHARRPAGPRPEPAPAALALPHRYRVGSAEGGRVSAVQQGGSPWRRSSWK